MKEEKSVFYIIEEIDKNILEYQEQMKRYFTDDVVTEKGYKEAKIKIKELLKHREQILKMNKKYGFSFIG